MRHFFSMKPKEVVVITGGAHGIGWSLAKKFLSENHKVAIIDKNKEAIEEVVATYSENKLRGYVADVTQENSLLEVGKKIKEGFGRPYVWINNAGIAYLDDFEKLSSQNFKKVMDVNFFGVVNGTRVALELMKKPERGMIVNISSASGKIPAPYMSAYTASKHAVYGFTKSIQLEKEFSESPIRMVIVMPGFVDTGMIFDNDEKFPPPRWIKKVMNDPDEIAQKVYTGVKGGKKEIYPGLNGKLMCLFHQYMPAMLPFSSRCVVSKNWKELLGMKAIKR